MTSGPGELDRSESETDPIVRADDDGGDSL